eukprot:gene21598-25937_t
MATTGNGGGNNVRTKFTLLTDNESNKENTFVQHPNIAPSEGPMDNILASPDINDGSGELDGDKPLKKHRNSQTLFYNTFNHLSLAPSDVSSPLSRSTSCLSTLDMNDSDQIPLLSRGSTFSFDSSRLNKRQLDFSSGLAVAKSSLSTPPSPTLIPGNSFASSSITSFSLSAPNSFMLGPANYSPNGSPTATPVKSRSPVKSQGEGSPPIPSTPILLSMELGTPVSSNNLSVDVGSPSPYKTPSKSCFIPKRTQNAHITMSLAQSSDSVFNLKKRSRTCLDFSSMMFQPPIIQLQPRIAEGDEDDQEDDAPLTQPSTDNDSGRTWKKAYVANLKPVPLPSFDAIGNISNHVQINCHPQGDEHNLKLPLCIGKPGFNNITPET